MKNLLDQEGVIIHPQAAMRSGSREAEMPAECGVSKNMQTRSQADTDSWNGLFDTQAGPVAVFSSLSI